MNTKLIMSTSAIFLAILGTSLIFLPEEIAKLLGLALPGLGIILLQLLGGLYFGFAMLNWMAKGSIIGGIYNKPLLVANLAHFTIGGLSLIKAIMKNPDYPIYVWLLTIIYIIFLLCFGFIFNRHPVKESQTK